MSVTPQRSDVKGLMRNGRGEQGGQDSTLSLFDGAQLPEVVSLRAPFLVFCSVLSGRAVVQADEEGARPIREGESLLVPPLRSLEVRFPEQEEPTTRWMVLKMDQATVESVMDRFRIEADAERQEGLAADRTYHHLTGEKGIREVMSTVSYLFRAAPPNRDVLVDLSVQQLVVQLLSSDARPLLTNGVSRHSAEGGIAAAVRYIQGHLDRHISIDELVDVACMSKSSFYRHFNDEFDMSPLEYITQQRVDRARSLLSDASNTVADVSHALGFSSTSYFIDMFRDHVGTTPKQYQLEALEN